MNQYKNILIINSDQKTLNTLTDYLCKDQNLFVCKNIESAKSMLRSLDIHLVISDLSLEESNKFELMKYCKTYFQKIHIALLSGSENPRNLIVAVKLGATDFISKPLVKNEIINLTARVFEFSSREKVKYGDPKITSEGFKVTVAVKKVA